MTPIYDTSGNVMGYYDDNMLFYDVNQQPITNASGMQLLYDPTTNSAIDPATAYGSQSGTSASVSSSAPPAGVAPGDWVSMFTDAVPKVINGVQAWQLSQINVQRAQAGLPPLNTATYATGQAGFMANMSSKGMLLLAGLAAVFLIGGKRK